MVAEANVAHVEQSSGDADHVVCRAESACAATGQALPSWLRMNHRRQMPEERRQMAIGQRHHAPWTKLMRRRPRRFGQPWFRQPSSGSSGSVSSWRCKARIVARCS